MYILNKEEIEKLAQAGKNPAVSILMPTHRVNGEDADTIMLKNKRTEMINTMRDRNIPGELIRDFTVYLDNLASGPEFPSRLSDGLAIYLSPEVKKHFIVPLHLKPRVVVGERFLLKPLVPLLSGDGRFYILALSMKGARLLESTRYYTGRVYIRDLMPESISESLKKYDEKQVGRRNKGRTAVVPGQGIDKKDALTREYMRRVNKGLRRVLAGETAPLVFAGPSHLYPVFRDACTYPHLVAEHVAGNTETMDDVELHRAAAKLIEPILDAKRTRALGEYFDLLKSKRTSSDIHRILPAAFQGRVKNLFIRKDRDIRGDFSPETGNVRLRGKDGMAGFLMNRASLYTLLYGGEVYTMGDSNPVEGDPAVAAVLRF